MRCPVYFNSVAEIVPVTCFNQKLAPNIAIAQGETSEDRRSHAFEIMGSDCSVDTVVILGGANNRLKSCMSDLMELTASFGKRAKPKLFDFKNPEKSLFDTLFCYFDQLATSKAIDTDAMPQNRILTQIENVSKTLQDIIADINVPAGLTLTNSLISCELDRVSGEGDYINGHIDIGKQHVLREVTCNQGSGTILFDQRDFILDFSKTSSSSVSGTFQLLNDQITCWRLVEGSSVMIRVVSSSLEETGARPSIHAHGIGTAGLPESRLTMRNDYGLA